MRKWTTVAAAVILGCGGQQAKGPSATQPVGLSPSFVCPDKNCTHNNGTGIYFAEDGFAGLGDAQLLITHFQNTGTAVTFQARYFDDRAKIWRALAEPGTVDGAEYPGLREPAVIAVGETDTVPRWVLQGKPQRTVVTGARPTAPAPTPARPPAVRPQLASTFPLHTRVTGEELRHLKLHLSVWLRPDERRRYVLDFAGAPENSMPSPAGREQRQPAKFAMRWRLDGKTAPAPMSYCRDAQARPDSVVFQRGITVDPVVGAVAANPAAVTISCSLGAPAKVYAWGYDYEPAKADAFYLFRAAIHMKRASYCADASYYTTTGTEVLVGDGLGINRDLPTARTSATELEAWWTPTGASCLNRAAERQPGIAEQKGFRGSCGAQTLPTCELPSGSAASPPYLIDAPKRR